MNTSFIKLAKMPSIVIGVLLHFFSTASSDFILKTPKVKEILDNEKFDLVFGEALLDESILAGVAWKNKAILVSLCTSLPVNQVNYAVGNPAPSSYIPNVFLGYRPDMNYFQRLSNLLASLLFDILAKITMFTQDRVMRKHFGDDLPYIEEIWKNTSLVLVNNHPALNFARPQLPNIIDVAGMHISPPKPLPKDLEEYMKNSMNGVILFSLGTKVKSSDLDPETILGILRAFGRMKENIIWKFETELKNIPKNVKIVTWAPQSDILAHPKLKLLITHGGMLSTTEAIFRGIPVVGIPVYADQPVNMRNIENAGWGITLPLDKLSEETLYNSVREVIENPKFRKIAKEKSKLLNDSPLTPLEKAVWWIEYALRNDGLLHFRSASQDLWYFQLHQWDVIIGIVALVASVIWILTKLVGRMFMEESKQPTKVKKDN